MTQGDSAYQLHILQEALRLAEQAGREKDALRRDMLIGECMQLWRVAQRVKDLHRRSRAFAAQARVQCGREGA
jgi:hypothetical protein